MSEEYVYKVFDYRYKQVKPSWATHSCGETLLFTMKGKHHWFWGLTAKEQEFYTVEGEASFLHHKYIISKALKKA
jgi:hypothetical protein